MKPKALPARPDLKKAIKSKPPLSLAEALRETGLKSRSLIKNLKDFHRLELMKRFLESQCIPITSEDGRQLWVAGKEPPPEIVSQKTYDERIETLAKQKLNWSEKHDKQIEADYQKCFVEKQPGGKEVYRIPRSWLDELKSWKVFLKSSGGKIGAEKAVQPRIPRKSVIKSAHNEARTL